MHNFLFYVLTETDFWLFLVGMGGQDNNMMDNEAKQPVGVDV